MKHPGSPVHEKQRMLSSDPLHIRFRLTLFQWIVGFIAIEVIWTFAGSGFTYLFLEITRNHQWSAANWVMYLNHHVNFIILLGATLLFIIYGVRVSILSFVTNAPRFRWPLFRFAFLVWICGVSIATIVTAIFEPHAITLNSMRSVWDRLTLIAIALIFTPLQCIAEELLFRTTLWRMLEGRFRLVIIPAVVSGLIFTVAHLTNLEVQSTRYDPLILLFYFLTGYLFMEMTRIHHGSEAAFGAHVANNLFLVMVVNYGGSSLPSDPWLIQQNPVIWLNLVVLILCSTIIIWQGKHERFSVAT